MGERCNRTAEVRGSIPLSSTSPGLWESETICTSGRSDGGRAPLHCRHARIQRPDRPGHGAHQPAIAFLCLLPLGDREQCPLQRRADELERVQFVAAVKTAVRPRPEEEPGPDAAERTAQSYSERKEAVFASVEALHF